MLAPQATAKKLLARLGVKIDYEQLSLRALFLEQSGNKRKITDVFEVPCVAFGQTPDQLFILVTLTHIIGIVVCNNTISHTVSHTVFTDASIEIF